MTTDIFSADADDKKFIDNNGDIDDDKNSASEDFLPVNYDSLSCVFVFEPNISSPGLDDQLNGSYDLCFGADVFFNHDITLFESPSKVLRQHINQIFDHHALATGREALDEQFDCTATSQLLIIKTVTAPFTFKSDNGKAKCLL